MDIYIKTNEFGIIIEYTPYAFDGFQKVTVPSDLVETNLIGWQYSNGELYKPLQILKEEKLEELKKDLNESKKIIIQNGKTLVIEHDTPERKHFLKLIEDVSNLSSMQGGAFVYEQQTDEGKLAFRILPEIATYIFKDLFITTLANTQKTKVNSRVHNRTTVYELALEQINKANTQAELDAIKWDFLNPNGIVIDVNAKAKKMLVDPTVSKFTKDTINAVKDPSTGEIHLVKTLSELAKA